MALVKCPECGKEVSDKADKCPNCGCPVEHIKKDGTNEELTDNKMGFVKVEENGKAQKTLSKNKAAVFGVFLIIAVVSVLMLTKSITTKNAEELISDLQGEWWTPYETSVTRTLTISGDEMILGAETGFDFLDSTVTEYTYSLKPKSKNAISASSSGDNYKKYTVEFNEDKTEFTISPALMLDEESETWYLNESDSSVGSGYEDQEDDGENMREGKIWNNPERGGEKGGDVLVLNNDKLVKSDDGYIYTGVLKNTGKNSYGNVEVFLFLYDDTGDVVAYSSDKVGFDNLINSGESVNIEIECQTSEKIDQYLAKPSLYRSYIEPE